MRFKRSLSVPAQFRKYKKPEDIRRVALAFAAIVGIGSLGLYVTNGIFADTLRADKELEAGYYNGNVNTVNDSTASGGKSVLFGTNIAATMTAPANLQAITGGDNIAVLWDLTPGTSKTELYKDGTLIATVTPGQGVIRADKQGTRYIDNLVTKGTTYKYKVRALDQNGSPSPFSPEISVTAPVSTTPVPTISLNNTISPDINDFLNTYAIPELKTWYPKISNAIAYPDYSPPASITLTVDTGFTSGLAAAGNVIHVNPNWIKSNNEDAGGAFVNMASQIVQSYPASTPLHIRTGVASWMRDWFTRERAGHFSNTPLTMTQGDSESALMLEWGQVKYSSDLVRKVNLAAHGGTYADSVISTATGKSPQTLYDEARQLNSLNTATIAVKNADDLCLTFGTPDSQKYAPATASTCSGSAGQQFKAINRDSILGQSKVVQLVNTAILPGSDRCLEKYGDYNDLLGFDCYWTYRNTQKWLIGANGSLVNVQTGMCMTALEDRTVSGTAIVTAACNGSSSQRWTLQ